MAVTAMDSHDLALIGAFGVICTVVLGAAIFNVHTGTDPAPGGPGGSSEAAAAAPSEARGSALRRAFLSGMAGLYLVAFLSYYLQYPGVFGEDGLVPLGPHLKQMASRAGGSGGGSWEGAARLLARQPTALWLAEPLDVALDAWAEGIALLGCVLSLLAMLGQQHVLVFIGLYALYLSLYLAGQSMLSFQWVSRHDIAGI